MSRKPMLKNKTCERKGDDTPVVRETRVVNGIESEEIDATATRRRLDGKRALVRVRDDEEVTGGQAVPATVHVMAGMLDDRAVVMVDYDRHAGRDVVPLKWVEGLLTGTINLGVDVHGDRHLWEPRKNRVVVETATGGIAHVEILEAGTDVRTWTQFVAEDRGWTRPPEGE
ncbi:hypothetical protein ACFQE1_03695 [Halobium palmae]|uniref:Uncharacterized protein n=1 Tax=Halobium palmae TaxID=1776492 RepID=A0ABD5RWF5_9EURY